MTKKEREKLRKEILSNFIKFLESREELKNNESVKEAYIQLKKEVL